MNRSQSKISGNCVDFFMNLILMVEVTNICYPFSPPSEKGVQMSYYSDLSLYLSENILQAPSHTAHSGPELMPRSFQADTLAREVVLDKISLVSSERPAFTASGSQMQGLKFDVK